MTIILTEEQQKLIKGANCINTNEGTFYNTPHWYKDIGGGHFIILSADTLPNKAKKTLDKWIDSQNNPINKAIEMYSEQRDNMLKYKADWVEYWDEAVNKSYDDKIKTHNEFIDQLNKLKKL